MISLYSGAGGLDHGFEAAGFRTAVAVEYDSWCCKTLRRNGTFEVIEKSIHDVSSADILEACRTRLRKPLAVGEADVLIGGPPCQPFSKAGYWAKGDSLRLDDPRAATIQAYLRVLEETQPKVFVLENVEGMTYAGKSEALDLLLGEIEAINKRVGTKYRPRFQVLCSADYGVPQVRNRFFMVGIADGTPFSFPAATHVDPAKDDLLGSAFPSYRTAWDALGDLEKNEDETLLPRGKWAKLLPSIPEGNNYLWHTDRGGGLPLFGWRRRYWSFLLKLAKDRPSWTVQAQPGPAIGPFHWESRRLSPRELCRLQTFPDNIEIEGGLGAVQKQLGNAVPSLLAEVLAREIAVQGLGLSKKRGAPTLLPPVRTPVPKPEPCAEVPFEYMQLVGKHEAHGGTGKGSRARASWAAQQ